MPWRARAAASRIQIALPIDDDREILVTEGGTGSVLIADARAGARPVQVPGGFLVLVLDRR